MGTSDAFKEIAHELHSTLAAIQVWIEVLGSAGDPQRASALSSARASVEAHARALDALLAQLSPEAREALPSSFASPLAGATVKRNGQAPVGGVRVLLVDDEPSARAGLTLLLGSYGVRVVAAASAAQARDLLARGEAVDVVILDVSMPGGGGVSALAQIRALGGAASVLPAIAFTALSPLDPDVEAANEAFDAVLTKPCEPEGLLAAIAHAVGRSSRGRGRRRRRA